MNDSIDTRLATIQGGVELINERLQHANNLAEERHAALREDIQDLRARHHNLSNRVQSGEAGLDCRIKVLEEDRTLREGQKQGFLASGKALVWVSGFIPGGIVVALGKLLLS